MPSSPLLTPMTDPLHKVSIIPRGQAGGATYSLPEKDRFLYTRKFCLEQLMTYYGGRAAEELVCGDVSSGASSDIGQATKLAKMMVLDWGMSDRVGTINYGVLNEQDGPFDLGERKYSDKTAETIDEEIKRLIDGAYDATRKLLHENREKLEAIAQAPAEVRDPRRRRRPAARQRGNHRQADRQRTARRRRREDRRARAPRPRARPRTRRPRHHAPPAQRGIAPPPGSGGCHGLPEARADRRANTGFRKPLPPRTGALMRHLLIPTVLLPLLAVGCNPKGSNLLTAETTVAASGYESKAHGGRGDFSPQNTLDGKLEPNSSWRGRIEGPAEPRLDHLRPRPPAHDHCRPPRLPQEHRAQVRDRGLRLTGRQDLPPDPQGPVVIQARLRGFPGQQRRRPLHPHHRPRQLQRQVRPLDQHPRNRDLGLLIPRSKFRRSHRWAPRAS